MNSNAVTKPWFGKLECVVGVLTTLVLASVLAALTSTFLAAVSPAPNGAAESLQVDKHDSPRVSQAAKQSEKIDVSPAATQPGVPEISTPARNTNVAAAGEARIKRTPTEAEAQEPPARAGASAPTPPAPAPGFVPEPPLHDFVGKTILIVAVIFALAIIAALAFVHCLFGLLRRHSQHFGPLIRIEYVAAAPMVVGPFSASSLGAAGGVQDPVPSALERNNRFTDGQAEHTAKNFDFGPTFETQRQAKDDQAKRQHEAVLQHLFADNLKLQEQIKLGKGKEEAGPSEENG
jgi:hypothetical protein